MDERRRNRLKVWTPLLFSLVMIFGMTMGFNLRDSLRNKRDIITVIERNDRLEDLIDIIEEKYVDSIHTDDLYNDAINGILSHLDPHTLYISQKELQSVNEDMEGSFYGIGVEFAIVKDTIQVTYVVPNGPAEKANVAIGDKIIKVNDSLVAGNNISSEKIMRLLRGKNQTKVAVKIYSPISKRIRNVHITRGTIPLYSLDAGFMLDEEIGYIRLNRFSATTYEEFVEAMTRLKEKGMQHLILDLRQNPGGYLDPATAIADDFLSGNKLIVYTEGKQDKRFDYNAGETNLFEKGRLAVLVDESSASASEVLAGAIQDWDRGVIVGRRSFGKGLVQEQYELEDGAALRLTIARYYSPSGRSIQRTYKKGREAYVAAFANRYSTGELTGIDTVSIGDTTRYFTHNKRVVYGGGGIRPDIYVPYDTFKYNAQLLHIIYSDELRNIVLSYYLRNKSQLESYQNTHSFLKEFKIDTLQDFLLQSLPKEISQHLQKTIKKPSLQAFLHLQLKAQLAKILFKNEAYYNVVATEDDVINKALETIKSENYSKIINRQSR